MDVEELVKVARGDAVADLVIRGGKLVNVHTGEIYPADISLKGERIVTIGEVDYQIGEGTSVIDASGRYLTPGMIDSHIHVGGSYLTMTQLARALLPRGTTAIATDFYEVGVVAGVEGIKFFLEEASKTPLKILFVAPLLAYLQHQPFSTTGYITPDDLRGMMEWPATVGLWEPPPKTTSDPKIRELMKLTLEKKKVVAGHACATFGRELDEYVILGGSSDHECVEPNEALMKARLGMRVQIREGSAASDIHSVSKAITEHKVDTRYFMFATDEEDPLDLARNGHMDYKVRKAVSEGVDPITAVQMATINAASYFKVDNELGSIAPGKRADILIVNDLGRFDVSTVVADGRIVATDGRCTAKIEPPSYPDFLRGTVRLKRSVTPEDFEVSTDPARRMVNVRVIGAKDGTLITERKTVELKVRDGVVMPDLERDVVKLAVVERHKASGQIGVGFITGFGLKAGAVASSFNPSEQNVVALGTNDQDMAASVNGLVTMGGGFIVVRDGKVLGRLELPILGIFSDRPFEEALNIYEHVTKIISEMGCPMKSPFLTLGFTALPVGIPSYKLTEFGLVDAEKLEHIDLFVA